VSGNQTFISARVEVPTFLGKTTFLVGQTGTFGAILSDFSPAVRKKTFTDVFYDGNSFHSPRFSLTQVKQYIHAPGQYLNSKGRMGIKLSPGEMAHNQINFMDVQMLERDHTVDTDHDDHGHSSCTNKGLHLHWFIHRATNTINFDAILTTNTINNSFSKIRKAQV
jgi:hypothetical protein